MWEGPPTKFRFKGAQRLFSLHDDTNVVWLGIFWKADETAVRRFISVGLIARLYASPRAGPEKRVKGLRMKTMHISPCCPEKKSKRMLQFLKLPLDVVDALQTICPKLKPSSQTHKATLILRHWHLLSLFFTWLWLLRLNSWDTALAWCWPHKQLYGYQMDAAGLTHSFEPIHLSSVTHLCNSHP